MEQKAKSPEMEENVSEHAVTRDTSEGQETGSFLNIDEASQDHVTTGPPNKNSADKPPLTDNSHQPSHAFKSRGGDYRRNNSNSDEFGNDFYPHAEL